MCSTQSLKPIIKRELSETGDDVVEILPRRAVTVNGDGFSVKIRDTSELTAPDVQCLRLFLKVRLVAKAYLSFIRYLPFDSYKVTRCLAAYGRTCDAVKVHYEGSSVGRLGD